MTLEYNKEKNKAIVFNLQLANVDLPGDVHFSESNEEYQTPKL